MSEPVCPCELVAHPRIPWNPPGRSRISYRDGDFASFRHALLLAPPGEGQLAQWRPSARQDLALQMVEWWAYLADVLTFYNERIANQAYLRTADLPDSLDRLVRLLGYRPRPGIGATGTVAALLAGPGPVTVPKGFQVQSKPGLGKQPQVFEVDAAIQVVAPEAVPAVPEPDGLLVHGGNSILLAGTVTTVKPGDDLLLRPRAATGTLVWAEVKSVAPEPDPTGTRNTRVVFTTNLPLDNKAKAADYQVMKPTLSARPWPYPTNKGVVITDKDVHLDSVARQITVGDPLVIEDPSEPPTAAVVVTVTSYAEVVWFANGDPANPSNLPSGLDARVPPIPILHTQVTYTTPDVASTLDSKRGAVSVRFGWQDAGRPIATPVSSVPAAARSLALVPGGRGAFPPTGAGTSVLVEDRTGAGVGALASGSASVIDLTGLSDRPGPLRPPLRALFALLPVSRGATVSGEVLGGGDAAAAGQEFTLRKSPLTYLPDLSSDSGYASTLAVFVDGVRWTETPSFYGQPPNARVFVTRQGPDGRTRVQFGDGVNGARLPSGTGNVVADYRHGSGADAPDVGSLTVVVRPLPGLRGVRNPVAVGGGSDPDPPEQLRRYAPRSALTFGRAVSADDYEVIAATAPGVARARSYWTFDALEQRALVTVFVGDAAAAVNAARAALAAAGDPNRPVTVKPATAVPVTLELTLELDPSRAPAAVVAAATAALVDPDVGLFGQRAVRIGQPVYASAIDAACVGVPGVLAVHQLTFRADRGAGLAVEAGPRLDPGEGAFFQLQPAGLTVHQEGATGA